MLADKRRQASDRKPVSVGERMAMQWRCVSMPTARIIIGNKSTAKKEQRCSGRQAFMNMKRYNV